MKQSCAKFGVSVLALVFVYVYILCRVSLLVIISSAAPRAVNSAAATLVSEESDLLAIASTIDAIKMKCVLLDDS